MRTLPAALLLLLPILAAAPARAERVDLSALPAELSALALRDDPGLAGKDLSVQEIEKIMKQLHRVPSVQSVSAVEAGPGVVRIEARLFRKIGAVRFTGLRALSESAARSAFGLSSGEAFEMPALVDAAERLRIAYRDAGVLNPVLDVETPDAGPGVVDLNVKVTEGAVTDIGAWSVASPDADLNRRLEKILNKKAAGRYTEERVRRGQDLARELLKDEHRLRAELTLPETRFSADETTASLTLKLDKIESYSLSFRGNKEISSGTLENDVLNLDEFNTANPNVTAELTEKIRQAYLGRGFARVEIHPEETEGRTAFSRRLLFEIDEGPRVRIESIEFRGRFSRSQDFYGDLVRANSSATVKGGFYNKDDLETGFKNLLLELQNQGYLVSKIISTRTQYSRDHSRIAVFVNLEEGPLTVVDSITFEGNVRLPSDELARLLDLRTGGPLQLGQIERSKQLIRTAYQERGYIEMQILNEREDLVTYNEDNTRAKLLFRISEGPQVRVASIITDGNAFTKDYVILNELDFETGDLLTPSKVEESIARLQRTGHFGSIEIRTLEEKTSVENRTVIVRVSERNPGTFTIGAGVTNEANQNDLTVRGYTGVGYSNIQGTGRGVSLRLDGNYNLTLKIPETKVTMGYLEPYLFNTRNRGRVNFVRKRIIEDKDPSVVKISEANQYTYSVERDFTSHVIGAWDILSLATYNDFYRVAPNPDTQLDIAMTTLRLDIDYRDNPFNPTRGHFTRMSVDYSSSKLGSRNADDFFRASVGYNFYRPLGTSRVVWANSVSARYLKSLTQGLDGGVPYEKVGFFLGGRSSLRGFSEEEIPNTGEIGGNKSYRLLTDATSGVIKSELRFPLYGPLDGALFYDGGSVRIGGLNFADAYRDSAGVGLRYNTPVGPLSLEYGWKLDRKAGEDEGRFHLAVGAF